GRQALDRPPIEDDAPGVGAQEAADDVEERRLAGAVRADQRGERAALDAEGGAVDGPDAAEASRHVGHLEDHSKTISSRLPRIPCGRKSTSPTITSPITISRR